MFETRCKLEQIYIQNFYRFAQNISQIFHTHFIIHAPEIISQMFVGNFEVDNLTWSIMPAQACIRCPFWSSHIKTLPSSLMVPRRGKFILKSWKAICFRFSAITSNIASEIFLVWKVSVSPSECSNIGKLFEWKILSLWSCQGGNYMSFLVICMLEIPILWTDICTYMRKDSQEDIAKQEY